MRNTSIYFKKEYQGQKLVKKFFKKKNGNIWITAKFWILVFITSNYAKADTWKNQVRAKIMGGELHH